MTENDSTFDEVCGGVQRTVEEYEHIDRKIRPGIPKALGPERDEIEVRDAVAPRRIHATADVQIESAAEHSGDAGCQVFAANGGGSIDSDRRRALTA